MAMVKVGLCLGYKVKIPAIFINYKMGQKLVNLLKEEKVSMKVTFDSIRAEVAVVTLYMQSRNLSLMQ